jgi:hypothetical protein
MLEFLAISVRANENGADTDPPAADRRVKHRLPYLLRTFARKSTKD